MTEERTRGGTAEQPTDRAAQLDQALRSLVDVGRVWASHGLQVGRSALETSAKTLNLTAEALADLAERFDRDQKTK